MNASASGEGPGKALSAWTVFALFACVYLLSLGRGLYSSDGEVMFQTAAALATQGRFALEPDPGLPQIVSGHDGSHFSKYDPGLPLLVVPFYVAGDTLGEINRAHRTQLAATAALFVPALAAAGTVAVVYGLARAQTSTRRGLIAALAAGLGTTLWPYARMLFAESVLALALTGTVALIIGAKARPARWLILAGAVFGAGVATRAAFGVYALPLAWLIVAQRQRTEPRIPLARLVAFGLGTVPAVALLLWHNALRFDDPLAFGYTDEGFTTPVWRGALGLLISPGKGALIYAPPLLLSIGLWPRWRRRNPALGGFLALAWIVALVFYGRWWAWDGGWCWGPRFLVPLLPLSCLPFAALPARATWQRAAVVVIALGIAVQALGVLTDVTPLYARVVGADDTRREKVNWRPPDTPLVYALERTVQGKTEPLALFHLEDSGLPRTWGAGLPALLVMGVILAGIRAGRVLLARMEPADG